MNIKQKVLEQLDREEGEEVRSKSADYEVLGSVPRLYTIHMYNIGIDTSVAKTQSTVRAESHIIIITVICRVSGMSSVYHYNYIIQIYGILSYIISSR